MTRAQDPFLDFLDSQTPRNPGGTGSVKRASFWARGASLMYSSQNAQRYNGNQEVRCMKSITIEVPDEMTALGGGTDEQLAEAMRLATAILWYRQGRISQGKAAQIAGLNRVLFLNALNDAQVDAFQVSEEELVREIDDDRSRDSLRR